MKIQLLLSLALVALLSACATDEPLIKYKYIGDEVPDALLQDCSVTAPPARAQYNSSTWPQKEALLSGALQSNYKNLTQCSADKAALRDWKAKQAQLRAQIQAKPAQ